MGGAIAVLSSQVDQMTKVLEAAQAAARNSADTLEAKTARGEKVAERLELILAAMHDLPAGGSTTGEPKKSSKASKTGKRASATPATAARTVAPAVRDDEAESADNDWNGTGQGASEPGSDAPATRARFVRRRSGRSESEAA